MGTLYSELQKWLKSPVKPNKLPKYKYPNPSIVEKMYVKEVGKKEQRNAPSVKSSTWGLAENTGGKLRPDLVKWDGKLPLAIAGKEVPYLVGQYAIDVATLANLPVQSLAYKTGHSPLLLPWALRYSPEQAYLDLGKLAPWEKWKVLWARIGAHYFQDTAERWYQEMISKYE